MSEHVVTNPAEMATHWRVAMSSLANLFLTMHRTLAAPMSLGPTELLIYTTIAVANVQKLMRERSIPSGRGATEILPREWVVPISRNAIASATGLPRETVRRHVARMVEAGMLIQDERGGVTTPIGMISNFGLEPLLEALLTEFARAAEGLLRAGVIEIQPGQGTG
ncbi:hypothetical protein U1839_10500 [Sphingomonas sp. RT2P30]|uniref:hypothetical protein n=1 Tax=Parasphingomonas halimpatiens TaxID=3096162 RepID=UPI002FCA510E